MAGPLQSLHQVVDRWLATSGQEGARVAASQVLALLDPLFAERWQDIPWSHLSSDGSPIQLSVDTARPTELRMVAEVSPRLANERDGMAVLARDLPADQARMLAQVAHLVGASVPRLGLGLRLRDGACKIYIGSDSPADFAPWIRSLTMNGLLPRDHDREALRLCERLATSSVMRGCAFAADASGAVLVSSIYYRSLLPYRRMAIAELLGVAGVAQAAPTAVAMAEALGFAEGTGKGCFGYMVGIGPDGSVDNLKIEFSRIPWCDGHELALGALGLDGLAPAQELGRIIAATCGGDDALRPEVVSWRGGAGEPASVVTYFSLPRGDPPVGYAGNELSLAGIET